MNEPENNVTRFIFADLVLDVQRGVLFRDKEVLPLPKLSYDLLLALLNASPTLLSQHELMEIVWPGLVIGDETLKQRIKLLRKSLDDKAKTPIYVEAVRGRGYRLIPEVCCECTIAKPSAVMVDLQSYDQFPNIATGQFPKLWQVISKVTLLMLFISAVLLSLIVSLTPEEPPSYDKSRIIVLPFKHSLLPEHEYIADKISASIVQRLAKISDKKLVSPSAVEASIEKQSDLKLLARKFNAGLRLEGWLTFKKEEIVVQLQLHDAQDESLLWSNQYSSHQGRLAELQLSLNKALVNVLKGNKNDSTPLLSAKHKLAFTQYQQGTKYYQRYRALDNKIAIDFFNKAIAIADDFSLAYAGLSQAHSQEVFQFDGDINNKNKAIDNAYQAITYNNKSSESYKSLGTAYYVSGWLSKSIDPYLKALELAPNNIASVSNIGFILSEQGKLVDALRWNQKALTIDNGHVVSMVHAGQNLQRLGHDSFAQRLYERAIDKQPDYLLAIYHLGQLQIAREQYDDAQQTYKASLNVYHKHPLLLEGLADSYFYSGNLALAKNIYAELYNKQSENQQLNGISHVKVMHLLLTLPPKKEELERLILLIKDAQNSGSDKAIYSYRLALIFAHTQKNEMAIRYLVQSVEQGLSNINKLVNQPLFKTLAPLVSYQQIISILKAKQKSANKQMSDNLAYWQNYTLLSHE